MHLNFTKSRIEKLQCTNPLGREFYRDTECRGLRIEVRASGGKTYYLSYRDQRGRQRMYKLASAADVSPQQARQLCDRTRAKIAMGEDPHEQRQLLKQSITVFEFFYEHYLPYVKTYKRSWDTDESVFRNHVQPIVGSVFIDAVSAEDVGRVMRHAQQRLSDATANRLLVLLRYMFNLAQRWAKFGVTANPTRHEKMKKLCNHRERFLTAAETQTLIAAVNESPNRMLRYIIPFLLLTGARKREVLDARWRDVDRARSFWRIPKTKSGRERHVPLSAAALELLDKIPKRGHGEWIFANPQTHKPYVSIFYSWDSARRRAHLAEVRIHDLRHSFASFLVNAGCTLYDVQKILGHSSGVMTQRYSHLSQDRLINAANHAAAFVTSGQHV